MIIIVCSVYKTLILQAPGEACPYFKLYNDAFFFWKIKFIWKGSWAEEV